jgi:acetyltransferase
MNTRFDIDFDDDVFAIDSIDLRSITIRPLQPSDHALERQFVESLSADALYQRTLGGALRFTSAHIAALLGYRAGPEMALAAIRDDGVNSTDGASAAQILGVARYAMTSDPSVAEMAVVVADQARGLGLGSRLLTQLHREAARFGYRQIEALTFADNLAMLALARRCGYRISAQLGDGAVRRLDLCLPPPLASSARAKRAHRYDDAQH